jgi:hypothetical protein
MLEDIEKTCESIKDLRLHDPIDALIASMKVAKVVTHEEEYNILHASVARKSKAFQYTQRDYQDDIRRYTRYLALKGEDTLLDEHIEKFLSQDQSDKAQLSKQIDDYLFDLLFKN